MLKFNDYLKIKDAAEFLGVTQNTLRNWEKENKIKVYKGNMNDFRLYKKEDLENILHDIKEI